MTIIQTNQYYVRDMLWPNSLLWAPLMLAILARLTKTSRPKSLDYYITFRNIVRGHDNMATRIELIRQNIDVNATLRYIEDIEVSLLGKACLAREYECVNTLLQCGVNTHTFMTAVRTQRYTYTALDVAISKADTELVRLLLTHCPMLWSTQGSTPSYMGKFIFKFFSDNGHLDDVYTVGAMLLRAGIPVATTVGQNMAEWGSQALVTAMKIGIPLNVADVEAWAAHKVEGDGRRGTIIKQRCLNILRTKNCPVLRFPLRSLLEICRLYIQTHRYVHAYIINNTTLSPDLVTAVNTVDDTILTTPQYRRYIDDSLRYIVSS